MAQWVDNIGAVETGATHWGQVPVSVLVSTMLLGSNLDDEGFCEVPHNLSTKDFLTLFQANHRISSPGPAELYRAESHMFVPGYGESYCSQRAPLGP